MGRNITYKPLSKDLERMVKPASSSMRPSLGLEGAVGEFFYIAVEDLLPFRNQARQSFDEDEINILADSIKLHGIRQPLTILAVGEGKYEVVSGERRLRAAKVAGLTKVPCIIINDVKQADAIALVENIHRKNLHPVELGITYKNLLDQEVFSNQTELANKISVTKSHVSEHLKYSDLEAEVQKFIIENKVTSRDKLRSVLKAHNNNDKERIKEILGINFPTKSNFSILRVTSLKGDMKFQERGIQHLSPIQRSELKQYLTKLMERI